MSVTAGGWRCRHGLPLDAGGIELSVWRIHRKIGMSEACSPNNRCARPRSKLIPSALNGCGGGNAEAYQRYASEIHPLPGLGARCSNCSNSIQHELNRVRREQDPKQPGERSEERRVGKEG